MWKSRKKENPWNNEDECNKYTWACLLVLVVNATRETLQSFKQFLVMKIYEALLKTSLRGQRDLSGLTRSALSQEIHFAETQQRGSEGRAGLQGLFTCSALGGTMPYGSRQYSVLLKSQAGLYHLRQLKEDV